MSERRARDGVSIEAAAAGYRSSSVTDADVPRVELPGGVRMPQLGLGTWLLRGEECERTVLEALELGYRHIDTAEGYGNEERIGAALRGSDRDAVFLTSKVSRDHLTRSGIRDACEGSLRRLGVDNLDLLLVHWPNSDIPIAETLAGFDELLDSGRIRAWGVSNFTPSHLRELEGRDDVATNQVELHPYFRQTELVEFCRARGIPITAYAPLAKGRVVNDPVLRRIGASHDATPAQVALRWSAQRGRVVIPKASSREHLASNLGIFHFELSEEELEAVESRPQSDRIVDGGWSEFDR